MLVFLLIQGVTLRGRQARNTGVARQSSQTFTANERLNVLHRFVGRCGCPSRPERYPDDTRTEYPRRMTWLSDSRVFQPESPPLRYLVPTGDEHLLRKLQRGLVLSSQRLPRTRCDYQRGSEIELDQACH